jgi:molybdopterin-guanine dinucleotide biosynthesis protein A
MKFSAVVLAGGRSERMGQDKGWLRLEGQSLLGRQIALARAAGADEVFISGRAGVDYSAFAHPVLVDVWPGCGPLGGIERALATARHGLVLVLAVDMPYLEVTLLAKLLAQCTTECGVVPVCDQRLEPLVALYPKAAHSVALALLQDKRYAARSFAEACCARNLVRTLRFHPAPRDFTNWNCPEDMAPASGQSKIRLTTMVQRGEGRIQRD